MWLDYFGVVDHLVFYVFCAVAGVVAILAVVNLVVGCVQDCCPSAERAASFSVDFFTSSGCILLTIAVLIQGADTDWGDKSDFKKMCEVYPVILLLGLTMFIGGLFVRAWSMFIFYRYNSDTKVRSQEWKPNLWILLLVLIIALISVIWVVDDTPELHDVSKLEKESANGDLPVYRCLSDHDYEWKVATSVWHGVLLFLAVLAIPINFCSVRGTPGSCDFHILNAVTINTLLAVGAGIIVHYMFDDDDTAMYAVTGGLMLWMTLFAQILFLIGKVLNCGVDTEGDSKYDTIHEEGGDDTLRTYRSSGSFENATFQSGQHSTADFNF